MQCDKGQIVFVGAWEHTTYKVKFIKKENKKRTVVEIFFPKMQEITDQGSPRFLTLERVSMERIRRKKKRKREIQRHIKIKKVRYILKTVSFIKL